MTDPVKAPAVPLYATAISTRSPMFKTHRTLSQAKNAVCHMMRFRRDYLGRRGYGADGVFNQNMTVYRFNPETGSYDPWIDIREGQRRSDHPELMPEGVGQDPPSTDPPGHRATAITRYAHHMTCDHQLCLEYIEWTDDNRVLSHTAIRALIQQGWAPRRGHWFCGKHADEDA